MDNGTKKLLILFPDTNVFLQCKSLEELDWSHFGDIDEIRLVVCRPIQAEIDEHKAKGGARLSGRARKTSSLFREIILSDSPDKIIQSQRPIVWITIRQELQWDAEFSEKLNYGERDDQLVGIVSLFSKGNDAGDVALLTHDTGPMASAKMVGVKFFPVPDQWLLPPENDRKDVTIKNLTSEIENLKRHEPCVEAYFINGKEHRIEINISIFIPLTQDEINRIIDDFKKRINNLENFYKWSNEHLTKNLAYKIFNYNINEPTDEDADSYRSSMDQWLHNSRENLQNIHDFMNKNLNSSLLPDLCIKNSGTRPAEDTLITLEAKGKFKIRLASHRNSKDEELILSYFPILPCYPRTEIQKMSDIFSIGSTFNSRKLLRECNFNSATEHNGIDRNLFYEIDDTSLLLSKISLECEQWRHQIEPELFSIEVHTEKFSGRTDGAITINVHANNMSKPFIKTIPVSLSAREISPYEKTLELTKCLFRRR